MATRRNPPKATTGAIRDRDFARQLRVPVASFHLRGASGSVPLRNTAAAAPTVQGSVSGTTVTRQSGGFGLDNTHTIDGETLVQPRIGFNYTFDYARPTQLRGGFGLFEGAAATVWISNIYSNTGVATRVVGCGTSGFAACPSAGGIFSANPTTQQTSFAGAAPAANVDFLADGMSQPSVWKANLAFEHKLPWGDMVFGLEYLATQNNVAIYYQHLNLGAPTRFGTDGRPLFYTPTILLLYTANDLTTGSENVLTRVFYNLVGITIGVLVVIYPFPRMMRMIKPKTTIE